MTAEHILDVLGTGLTYETKNKVIAELTAEIFGKWCKADAVAVEIIIEALNEAK